MEHTRNVTALNKRLREWLLGVGWVLEQPAAMPLITSPYASRPWKPIPSILDIHQLFIHFLYIARRIQFKLIDKKLYCKTSNKDYSSN